MAASMKPDTSNPFGEMTNLINNPLAKMGLAQATNMYARPYQGSPLTNTAAS